MSTVHRQTRAVSVPPPDGAAGLCVRWSLSLPALMAARARDAELGSLLARWGAPTVEPVLEWTVDEDGGAARAVVRGPAGVAPLFESNGITRISVVRDPESSLRHVEVTENGETLLRAVLDGADGAALYGQTSLLTRLGLTGGRYEVVR